MQRDTGRGELERLSRVPASNLAELKSRLVDARSQRAAGGGDVAGCWRGRTRLGSINEGLVNPDDGSTCDRGRRGARPPRLLCTTTKHVDAGHCYIRSPFNLYAPQRRRPDHVVEGQRRSVSVSVGDKRLRERASESSLAPLSTQCGPFQRRRCVQRQTYVGG